MLKNLQRLLAGVLCFITSVAAASTALSGNQLTEYLVQEKNKLSQSIQDAKQFVTPQNMVQYQQQLQENNDLLALSRAKIASLESFLVNQKKLQIDFGQRLKQLQQFPAEQKPQISIQEKVEKINTLNEINKKTIVLISTDIALANHYQDLLLVKGQQLDLWKSRDDLQQHLALLRSQEEKLNTSIQKLFDNSLKLQQTIQSNRDFKTNYNLEARLLLNNQVINLTQHKIAELNLQRKLAKADYLLLKNPDIRTLKTVADSYQDVIEQLSEMEQALKRMAFVLKNEQNHITDTSIKQQFISLLKIVNARIAGISIQEQTLQEDLENHQQELKKQLSVRQSLSDYRLESWPQIFSQVLQIPGQFLNYIKSLAKKTADNYLWQDTLPAILIWLAVASLIAAAVYLHRLLRKLTQDKNRSRLSGHLYDGLLNLLSYNLPLLAGMGVAFLLFYFNQVPFANYQLLFNLMTLWVTFRTLILIARMSLLERISDESGSDVRLYYRIKWLLLTGAWTTALMLFSHQLPLPAILQDIFNLFFMLFLLAVSLVAWKSRGFINHILHPILVGNKRYLRNAIMLLVVLLPLTLFTTALLGLVGYINLAWTMSRYQMQFLVVLSAYVLMRGLLFDALELLSEWMIRSLNNGWLWVEVWLKPLDNILRASLLFVAVYVLFQLFDWHSDSAVISSLLRFSEYPLVNMAGIHITARSIAEFVVLLLFFAWAAKWTREFSYRWLYRNARDAGVRNSMSVFTQYALILIGGLITLRVLGLDFSGMSMVIGGLAVGMGFGLRDFASNIVGGLMLLIERPVREGDVITLGTYEGRVAHIGIRSMRVSSWDNMEVLIPNAETFNKPFTNWTHQDSIVRTVVPIKVCRSDDPIIVQQLIIDALSVIPEILPDPPAQVFLKQIDNALLEFEVRYFINIQIHTRFEIRSKVLFEILDRFKTAGIKSPVPPLTVELIEENNEYERVKPRKLEQRN